MLGADESAATDAAAAVERFRDQREGPSVRGDVV
jgi:hypothetical protein